MFIFIAPRTTNTLVAVLAGRLRRSSGAAVDYGFCRNEQKTLVCGTRYKALFNAGFMLSPIPFHTLVVVVLQVFVQGFNGT